jgi:hypothetical protein
MSFRLGYIWSVSRLLECGEYSGKHAAIGVSTLFEMKQLFIVIPAYGENLVLHTLGMGLWTEY